MPTVPGEDEVLSWFDQLSNWGRWGPDDRDGTSRWDLVADVRIDTDASGRL
jgi:hypothetical protein